MYIFRVLTTLMTYEGGNSQKKGCFETLKNEKEIIQKIRMKSNQ